MVTTDNIKDIRKNHLVNIRFMSGPTNDILIHLKGMPIQNLEFGIAIKVSDKGYSNLIGMPLKEFYLNMGLITDYELKLFSNMPLKKLSLISCPLITDRGLSSLKNMPLEELSLNLCDNISKKYRKEYTNPQEIKQMLEEVSKKYDPDNKDPKAIPDNTAE